MTLEPGFRFLEVAYPYVARRLLTDEDPALRERLFAVRPKPLTLRESPIAVRRPRSTEVLAYETVQGLEFWAVWFRRWWPPLFVLKMTAARHPRRWSALKSVDLKDIVLQG